MMRNLYGNPLVVDKGKRKSAIGCLINGVCLILIGFAALMAFMYGVSGDNWQLVLWPCVLAIVLYVLFN
jgi:hypothetical protein